MEEKVIGGEKKSRNCIDRLFDGSFLWISKSTHEWEGCKGNQ